MSDLRRALDFIEAAEGCASLADLQTCLSKVLNEFGASQFTLMAMSPQPSNGARRPVSLSEATPPEWRRRYGEKRYFNSDIVAHAVVHQPDAFTWEDLPLEHLSATAKSVFNEGREIMKVKGSLVIPTHDARGVAGYISLFFDDGSPDISLHRALKLIAIYALEKAKELKGLEPDRFGWDGPCPLTPRQREALAFMATGKTDWEIGVILGIAQKTASNHLEAVRKQLGVVTRAQAVGVAVNRGWITI